MKRTTMTEKDPFYLLDEDARMWVRLPYYLSWITRRKKASFAIVRLLRLAFPNELTMDATVNEEVIGRYFSKLDKLIAEEVEIRKIEKRKEKIYAQSGSITQDYKDNKPDE